jgi:Haem-binding domain
VEAVENEELRLARVRFAKQVALVVIVGAGAIQLARPARTNPTTDPSRTLMAVTDLPAEVQSVLERSCRDCHSHDTRWPWYSNVAPVSWLVIDDVNHGRGHFNYSDWAQYDHNKVPQLLHDICDQTRKGEMPLSIYLWMHPDARLSDSDVTTLCSWSEIERRAH